MRSFYVRELRVQIFCANILGLYFTGARLLAQKLRVESWWNWPVVFARNNESVKTEVLDREIPSGRFIWHVSQSMIKLSALQQIVILTVRLKFDFSFWDRCIIKEVLLRQRV